MCVVHGGGGDRFRELIRWFGESGSSRDPPRPVNTKLAANYLACQRPTVSGHALPSTLLLFSHFLFFPRFFSSSFLHREMGRKFRVPIVRVFEYRNFIIRWCTVFAARILNVYKGIFFFFLDFSNDEVLHD